AYVVLLLLIPAGGIWRATVGANACSRFLVFWLVASWLSLSSAGEKMPWLNTHIALPTALFAASTVQLARHTFACRRPQAASTLPLRFASVVGISMGAMLMIAYLPGGSAYALLRLLIAVFALAAIVVAVGPYGSRVQAITL